MKDLTKKELDAIYFELKKELRNKGVKLTQYKTTQSRKCFYWWKVEKNENFRTSRNYGSYNKSMRSTIKRGRKELVKLER